VNVRSIVGALGLVLAAAGCGGAGRHAPALPREALPTIFDPLRWSVQPEDIPALFPNREARRFEWRSADRHVVWSVDDVRRVAGVPGSLQVDWAEGGPLWMARLAFSDPRDDCDPDIGRLPLRCDVPGTALTQVFDALEAELAKDRGAPDAAPAEAGGRAVSWRGMGFALRLSLAKDRRGAWSTRATATPERERGTR
jgi:hypothetical protein